MARARTSEGVERQRKAGAAARKASAKASAKGKTLSDRQRRFIEHYLILGNASEAARRAGYAESTATTALNTVAQHPLVKAEIDRAMAERAERCSVRADDVLRELLLLALSDIRHFSVTPDGRLAVAEGVPDVVARAVQAVKTRTYTDGSVVTEIKLWDKPATLRMLAQHLGLLVDRVDVTTQGEKVAKQVIRFGGVDVEF